MSDDENAVAAGTDSTPDDWMHITKPGPHDVLCGRGGGTNNHSGNVKFRHLINEHKLRYLAASKVEKPKVAREVVKLWRGLTPPGRFLSRKDSSKKGPGSVKAEGNVWYDIGDKKAREKASQCLRERTPDVLPYVREMQRRQDLLTGQGLRIVEQQMRMRNEGQQQGQGGMSQVNQATYAQQQAQLNGMAQHNGMAQQQQALSMMGESDINNAFSVEHFFTHGFQNAPQQAYNVNPDDPLSMQQLSRDQQQWNNHQGFAEPQQTFSKDMLEPVPLAPTNFDVGDAKPDHIGSGMHPIGIHDGLSGLGSLNGMGSGLDSLHGMPSGMNNHPGAGLHQGIPNGMTSSSAHRGANNEPSLEEYMQSMQDYPGFLDEDLNDKPRTSFLDDDLSNGKPRTDQLLKMQENSWVRSFHSIDNASKASGDNSFDTPSERKPKKSSKLEAALGKHNRSAQLSKQQSTRTTLTSASHKSAMSTATHKSAQSAMSGISMFSDMSDRSSKMGAARGLTSNMSVMSDFTDLTDLSETLNNIDLAGAS